MLKKLHSRSGFTLSEQLVTLLISVFVMAAIVSAVLAAWVSARHSRLVSQSLMLADTINSSLSGLLSDSDFMSRDGDTVHFVNSRYSGYELTLTVSEGIISVEYFDGVEVRTENLLSPTVYGVFLADGISLDYDDGIYTCEYSISHGSYSHSVSVDVVALNPS